MKEIAETKKSVIEFMAGKYGMERTAFEAVIKETVMPGNVKNEEFVAFLSVAKEYDLNPLTKQIYAFAKGGKVVAIVPVDGWSTIINRNPQFDGAEFIDVVENGKVISVECKIYRKDRSRPISAIEYLEECQVATNPAWKQWPRRMLRHKALIQAARYAFGLGGIYDPDEGERIISTIDVTPKSKTANAHTPPAAIDQCFVEKTILAQGDDERNSHLHPSLVMAEQEDIFVEKEEDQKAEEIFKRISSQLRTLITVKAINAYVAGCNDDMGYLELKKPEYHAEILSVKNRCLEELNAK